MKVTVQCARSGSPANPAGGLISPEDLDRFLVTDSVDEAIAYLQSTNGVPPTGVQQGTTAEGTWQYRVTALPRNHYQIDAVGTVGDVASLAASRRIRVILAPPTSFRYALFSLSDVTTKNNNVVCGDVWANTYVTVYQGDEVLSADSADSMKSSPRIGSLTVSGCWSGPRNPAVSASCGPRPMVMKFGSATSRWPSSFATMAPRLGNDTAPARFW